jgi:N-acetylneuraminate synthase
MEFSEKQWAELKAHADERGLLFLSSPFSLEAIELLTRVGVAAWKVASGETASLALFERMAATKWPVLLSTGMSGWTEIDALVGRIQQHGLPFALLQCTTAYPCPAEKVGLNVLDEFRRRYSCAVGLSDHSGTIYPGLAAAAKGASVVEVHVTMSREMFGPDVVASVTTVELKQMVEGIRFINRMQAHPLNKDESAAQTQPLRQMFGKSIVARTDLPAGTVLTPQHLSMKKPGSGLGEERMSVVLNRKLKNAVPADGLILEDSLE